MFTESRTLVFGQPKLITGAPNEQGHPTDGFGKLSVRKALNPLQFSEGNFHLELS